MRLLRAGQRGAPPLNCGVMRRASQGIDSRTKEPQTDGVSEFRYSDGTLHAFEIRNEEVDFGSLCQVLARLPGVTFIDAKRFWAYPRPARFMFKGVEYEVCIPIADFWVGPTKSELAHAGTEELLVHVRRTVLGRKLYKVLARIFVD